MSDRRIVDTWELLVRYHRTTVTAMDRRLRSAFGHSLDDYDVLHQISFNGSPIRMGALAENLLVANSSCNRIVARLVERGLVERSHADSDGRVVLVDLTRAGNTLRRRMAVQHSRDIEARFGALITPAELADIDAVLRRMLAEPPAEV